MWRHCLRPADQQAILDFLRSCRRRRDHPRGAGLAIFAFLAPGTVASWLWATPGGGQTEAMFGDFSLWENTYAAIALIAAGIAILAHFVSRVIVSRHLRGLSRSAAFNKFRARVKSLGSGRRGWRQAPRPTSSRRCSSLKKSQNSAGREWWERDADTEDIRAKINRAKRRCAARSKKLPAFGARLTKFELADH